MSRPSIGQKHNYAGAILGRIGREGIEGGHV